MPSDVSLPYVLEATSCAWQKSHAFVISLEPEHRKSSIPKFYTASFTSFLTCLKSDTYPYRTPSIYPSWLFCHSSWLRLRDSSFLLSSYTSYNMPYYLSPFFFNFSFIFLAFSTIAFLVSLPDFGANNIPVIAPNTAPTARPIPNLAPVFNACLLCLLFYFPCYLYVCISCYIIFSTSFIKAFIFTGIHSIEFTIIWACLAGSAYFDFRHLAFSTQFSTFSLCPILSSFTDFYHIAYLLSLYLMSHPSQCLVRVSSIHQCIMPHVALHPRRVSVRRFNDFPYNTL